MHLGAPAIASSLNNTVKNASKSSTSNNLTSSTDDITLILLSVMIGFSAPLLLKNIYKANWKRVLHVANAIQSILYLILSVSTLIFRLVPFTLENDCNLFRRCQSALFFAFVISYEFVLGYKAKAIMGSRTLFGGRVQLGSFLLFLALAFRFIMGSMSVYSTTPKLVNGACFNDYSLITHINAFSRNAIDVIWAILFALPIYKIMSMPRRRIIRHPELITGGGGGGGGVGKGSHHINNNNSISSTATSYGHTRNGSNDSSRSDRSSEELRNESFYRNIKASPYAKIFIANCLYPVIGNLVTFSIAVSMLVWQNETRVWQATLYAGQNFITSYTLNLILDLKVTSSTTARVVMTTGDSTISGGGDRGQIRSTCSSCTAGQITCH